MRCCATYIGGPTEISTRMSRETTPTKSSLESVTNTVLEDRSEIISDNNEDTELPEGDAYTLNSRYLNATHLQCVAEPLSLLKGGSMATTRQLIEGKLVELDHEPSNVHVILQGKDQGVHKFFLLMTMVLFAHVHPHMTTMST